MTAAVLSRWYRAPEVIVTEHYTQAIDIYIMGIILYELLSCSIGSKDKRFPYQGSSCFPLSPQDP